MELHKEESRTRLFKAMALSWTKLEPFRVLNRNLVEEYAGSAYGYPNRGDRPETMMNLMNQAVDAYTMSLAANRPKAMVETSRPEMRYFANHFAIAINNLLQEIRLEEKLRKWVRDAFFCVGIMKTHMADAGEVELWDGGDWIDPGSPFASNVGLDDFVYDMSATRWDQVRYAADCYRLPFEELSGNQFDKKVVADLAPTNRMSFMGWGERVEMLSKGYQGDADDVEPMIDLMDIWDSRGGKIWTFVMDPTARFQGKLAPVAVLDWDGPEQGPYHILSFDEVPENIMPTSPAAHLSSLARLANNLIRKQGRQARRQKDVHTYTPAGAEGAKKLQKSSDGDWVEVDDTKEVGLVKMGGVDAGNQAFMMHTVDLFDRMAGNLPAMLGLGSQADTLGQEQLIAGSVSKKDAQMRMRCMDATRGLVRNLAFMLWHDVAKVLPGRMSIPGVPGASIDSTWTPEHRMGEFHDYDLDIDVFSMQYQAPAQKVAAINTLLSTIYLPAQQSLAAQGGQINWQKLASIHAEGLNLPQFADVVTFSAPQQQGEPQGGGVEQPQMPPNTTRKYIRQDAPSSGQMSAGKLVNQQMASMAKAGQTNPDQAMSMAS